MLGMMQVSKYVPFEEPNVLNTVRGVYIATNVFIALLYVYIQLQINKQKSASLLLRLVMRSALTVLQTTPRSSMSSPRRSAPPRRASSSPPPSTPTTPLSCAPHSAAS